VSELDLSAALRPLHAAYLRRLEEMASRVPAEALLRESTTRGPDGALALGSDGLPLCFDVADLRTAETFEVRGSAPDAPAAPGGTFGAVQIDLKPGNWEALVVEMSLEGLPTDADLLDLAELVRAWAQLAAAGAFSRMGGAAAPWSGRLHSLRLEASRKALTAVLDLGTCPPEALSVLLAALDGQGRDARSVARVTFGGAESDPQNE
jgi:hypothetical protein